MHIVLFEPQIPPNTGTIGRLSLATRCRLHLIEPLGFDIDDKALRRAGMDYWAQVDCMQHPSWEAYLATARPERVWLFTTKGQQAHWHGRYRCGDHLLFGNEGHGAPPWMHDWIREQHGDAHRVRLPMSTEVAGRSLNLANTVSCAVYEGLRQLNEREPIPF